jgi:hypothetical protein
MTESLGRFGHHPEAIIDAEVEIGRLQGLLMEARAGLNRALDYNAITPNGLSIKYDIRHILKQTDPAATFAEGRP